MLLCSGGGDFPCIIVIDLFLFFFFFFAVIDKWKRVDVSDSSEFPKIILDAIKLCDKDVYPSVNALLEIGSILPVSTPTVERYFSKRKRKKNYIRSSTSEDRLNGLTLMNVYLDLKINIESVLNRFASSKNRRMLLLTVS